MAENYIVINGKKAELTPEQLKALGIEVKKPSPFEMGEEDSEYYFITSYGVAMKSTMRKDGIDDLRHRVANYCTDESLLLQQAYRETLNRLLWRFSMEHDGDKIDWSLRSKRKWKVKFSSGVWTTEWNIDDIVLGSVYFISQEVAEQAIEEIVKPFMESHPDFKP